MSKLFHCEMSYIPQGNIIMPKVSFFSDSHMSCSKKKKTNKHWRSGSRAVGATDYLDPFICDPFPSAALSTQPWGIFLWIRESNIHVGYDLPCPHCNSPSHRFKKCLVRRLCYAALPNRMHVTKIPHQTAANCALCRVSVAFKHAAGSRWTHVPAVGRP